MYVSVFLREKNKAAYEAVKDTNGKNARKARDIAQFYHGAEWSANGISVALYKGNAEAFKRFVKRQTSVEAMAARDAKTCPEPKPLYSVMQYLEMVGLYVEDD